MRIIDIFKISLSNLSRQKLRTLLTIASIVIGATLISLVYAVIPGFQKFLNSQLNTFSSPKLIEIYASKQIPGGNLFEGLGQTPKEYDPSSGGGNTGFNMGSFTDADIQKIGKIPGVKKVHESPIPSVEYVSFSGSDKKFVATYVFYYPTFLWENLSIVSGRKLTDSDSGKAVVAEQYTQALGLQNPSDLVGKKIILHVTQSGMASLMGFATSSLPIPQGSQTSQDFELEIVGVTEKGILSSIVFIPLPDDVNITEFYRNTDNVLNDKDTNRYYAWVEVNNASDADSVMSQIKELGFSGTTYEQSKSVLNNMFVVLNVVFSSFGILAMAVSSLGILNTLVMAVYERTREIGVMKALGATRKNIALLFTVEASLIGFLGGVIGLALGFGLAEVLNIVGHKTVLAPFESLSLANVSILLLIAPVISTVVATIAGIYPSIRASRLDPVKALRYE